MQKNLAPLVIAAMLVSLAAATLSMLTLLKQRDLDRRLADTEQRVVAIRQTLVEQATGKSLDSLLEEFKSPPADGAAGQPGAQEKPGDLDQTPRSDASPPSRDEDQLRENLREIGRALSHYAERNRGGLFPRLDTPANGDPSEEQAVAPDPSNDPEPPEPLTLHHKMRVVIDRQKLEAFGIDEADIGPAVRKAIDAGQKPQDIMIPAPGGKLVPLRDIATFHEE